MTILDRYILQKFLTPFLCCFLGFIGIWFIFDLSDNLQDFIQGKATMAAEGRPRDVTILAELEAGAQVQLAAGATLVALYLDAGDEYVFKGPAAIVFKAGQPDVTSGAKPEKRSSSLGKGGNTIRIKPVGMAQGAMVMRGFRTGARIQLLNLHKTRTLETQPEFRWQELQAGHQLERLGHAGRAVHLRDYLSDGLLPLTSVGRTLASQCRNESHRLGGALQ